MIKTSEYYYIDYQYILADEKFLGGGEESERGGGGNNPSPKLLRSLQDELNMMINNEHPFDHPLTPFYFGRINRLQLNFVMNIVKLVMN